MIGFLGNPRFGGGFLFEFVLNGLKLGFFIGLGWVGGGRGFDELGEKGRGRDEG